jgi:hypothetical protein
MSEDERRPRESTELLTAALGIGAVGAVGAIVGGAVCPLCVIVTPALLGMGLYKRWTERAARQPEKEDTHDAEARGSAGSRPEG